MRVCFIGRKIGNCRAGIRVRIGIAVLLADIAGIYLIVEAELSINRCERGGFIYLQGCLMVCKL